MADMLIETQIDELAKLVVEKKKISVRDAARILKITEAQVEEWVRILEESEFLELTYPALGEPIIVLKKVEGNVAVKKKKELENRQEVIEEKTKDFQKKIENVEKKVELSNKEFSRLESELKPKIKNLDKNLKILDSLETQKNQIIKKSDEIKSVVDSVNKEVNSIRDEINQMEGKINEHIKAVGEHETSIKNLDEDKKAIENEINNLEKDVKLIRLFIKRPIIAPLIDLKKIFTKHKQKSEEIEKKRKDLHKKALKMKSVLIEKKS